MILIYADLREGRHRSLIDSSGTCRWAGAPLAVRRPGTWSISCLGCFRTWEECCRWVFGRLSGCRSCWWLCCSLHFYRITMLSIVLNCLCFLGSLPLSRRSWPCHWSRSRFVVGRLAQLEDSIGKIGSCYWRFWIIWVSWGSLLRTCHLKCPLLCIEIVWWCWR